MEGLDGSDNEQKVVVDVKVDEKRLISSSDPAMSKQPVTSHSL